MRRLVIGLVGVASLVAVLAGMALAQGKSPDATEQQAVADALGRGAFSSLRWTLVRAVNRRGRDERPVASADWDGALNSWWPVSYDAMGRWMLEEATADEFVRAAPLVSRRRR